MRGNMHGKYGKLMAAGSFLPIATEPCTLMWAQICAQMKWILSNDYWLVNYGGMRLYQYNEYDFLFKFWAI